MHNIAFLLTYVNKNAILCLLYYSNTNAFMGQNRTHFPHLMHLSWSTVGASNSF
jgi:hypothetical protein